MGILYREYQINSRSNFLVALVARRPKVDLMGIGSRIRALRGKALQEELAAYLHIRQGHLSKIERGRSAPTIEVLLLLSQRFHRSIDWILKGEEN